MNPYFYLVTTTGFAALALHWLCSYLNNGGNIRMVLGIVMLLFMVASLWKMLSAFGV
jgi:hypothetical protein